ncbi:MAG TPA: DUF86 domain-containing protein [Anaerolineales bacterium]|nr:DUF86 domain-containing protein [Anaerolineales bacterium]
MRRDDAYLLDILIAARKALKFVQGIDQNKFEDDEIIQNAVMRPLEIIGEASARVSKEFRKAHAEIPWREMVGLRNRLIHEYFRVDFGAVWDTIHKDLPKLIEIIEPLVPKEDEI